MNHMFFEQFILDSLDSLTRVLQTDTVLLTFY